MGLRPVQMEVVAAVVVEGNTAETLHTSCFTRKLPASRCLLSRYSPMPSHSTKSILFMPPLPSSLSISGRVGYSLRAPKCPVIEAFMDREERE